MKVYYKYFYNYLIYYKSIYNIVFFTIINKVMRIFKKKRKIKKGCSFVLYKISKIVLSHEIAHILEFDEGDKVLFSFDDKTGNAYIAYGSDEGLSLSRTPKETKFRFTSRQLREELEEFFQVNTWDSPVTFIVDQNSPVIYGSNKFYPFKPKEK